MIIGYKQKFPWGESTFFRRKIEEKTKKHTIRMDAHDRWHAGIKIQHAYGVRTKKYEQFGEGVCISTQKIEITIKPKIENSIIKVDNKRLTKKQMTELAWNDGFNSLLEFWFWFNKDFSGKIIHWTDLKY